MKTAAFIALSLFLGSTNAHAYLTGDAKSPEADRAMAHGIRSVNLYSGYQVHTITTDGNSFREYVSTSGVVFCVAWNGIARPDLSQLFGPYYAEYLEAERSTQKPKGRSEMTVVSPNLKVSHFGHMRAIRGRACVPAQVPSGFDLTLVQ